MSAPTLFFDGRAALHAGDCRDVLKTMTDNSVDSVVTDPPYALVSIVKRFGKTSLVDETDTSDRSRKGADSYARLAKGFMGKEWDNGDAAFSVEFWAEVLRVLKPGGHVAAFSGTRTYHRLACAIEDAGFEIRDQLAWVYGTGFPKSHDVSKGIDKAAGAERQVIGFDETKLRPNKDGFAKVTANVGERGGNAGHQDNGATVTAAATDAARAWEGWGTALKPSWEPIVLARKPLSEGTVAANVLRWGTGALNIAATRIATDEAAVERNDEQTQDRRYTEEGATDFAAKPGARRGRPLRVARRNEQSDADRNAYSKGLAGSQAVGETTLGRWPANLIHDGSDEVLAAFPDSKGQQGDVSGNEKSRTGDENTNCYGEYGRVAFSKRDDSGSAARFFYSAKADADDRLGSKHPTVKPVDLMRWLVRLVTPPSGIVLDPFAGTGTTGEAALREGFAAALVEREAEYQADIAVRMAHVFAPARERKATIAKAKGKTEAAGPLFDLPA